MENEPHGASLTLAVAANESALLSQAEALAERLFLPCVGVPDAAVPPSHDALLRVSSQGLSLSRTEKRAPAPLSVDFGSGTMRHRRRGGQNELLGKAVGVGKAAGLHVVDATAGLGRDAFVLADLGCRVSLFERHPVVAALLADGLQRATGSSDPWLSDVAGRMSLQAIDARDRVPEDLDTIYLDPMFPARNKRAAVKADLALLQDILEETAQEDAEAVLRWALSQDVARVVVKRPLKAEWLDNRTPSHSHKGKAVRFDVHVLRGFER